MKTVTLTLDGKTVEAREGDTILEAARRAGVQIPTLCYDERLKPAGACRMCMVEVDEGRGKKLVASCVYPVKQGLQVRTSTERIRQIRRMIIELLWPSWQVYAEEYGVTRSRFEPEVSDCCYCGLCVRYCREVKQENAVYFEGRGIDRKPALVPGVEADCSLCRECFSLCPSGWVVTHTG